MTEITRLIGEQLQQAEEGSWYTILGAGGELSDWVNGYEHDLKERGMTAPIAWYETRGVDVNVYAMNKKGVIHPQDLFKNDLRILMFPLDGIGAGLPIFKVMMEDRWFDDIISNMRVREMFR